MEREMEEVRCGGEGECGLKWSMLGALEVEL